MTLQEEAWDELEGFDRLSQISGTSSQQEILLDLVRELKQGREEERAWREKQLARSANQKSSVLQFKTQ